MLNVPFNPYHLSVNGQGFAAYSHDIDVRSVVPVELSISLKVATSETVTVEAGGAEDLLENDSTFHTDVDKSLFDKLPLESSSLNFQRNPLCDSACDGATGIQLLA